MKKIVVAYHAYMFGDHYMTLMREQFRLLIHSGLYNACDKLYIGIVMDKNMHPGKETGIAWANGFYNFATSSKPEKEKKVEIAIYPQNNEETDTMKWIRDYSKDNPGDYVLYWHTKGITKDNQPTTDWRHYMEYFCIEQWKDCIAKLEEGFDCCGVLWNTDTPLGMHPHFSGTFWWARTDCINTLDHSFLDSEWRYAREFWIGSNPKARAFEFHNSRLNDKESLIAGRGHYDVEYPRENYVKKKI